MPEERNNKVIWEKEGHIAWLTINRPDVRNAIDMDVWARIPEVAAEIDADKDVRCAIITGAGDKAFSAGLDLKAGGSLTDAGAGSMAAVVKGFLEKVEGLRNSFTSLERMRAPVIAAVNGYCLGAACEMILACDIRLAADTARFSIPEVALNIVPDMGSTQRLPRVIGMGKAKELLYTARRIDAARALEIGLVDHVYPLPELRDRARELAEEIASNGPLAVEATKKAVNMSMNMPLEAGLAYESVLAATNIIADDVREGFIARVSKKKPKFNRK